MTTRAERRLKPFLWFTLLNLVDMGAASRQVKVSTTRLSSALGCSQQSASRHLRLLERMGLVTRRIGGDGSLVKLTDSGVRALGEVYSILKRQLEGGAMEELVFEGVVFTGLYEGAYYISQTGYRNQILQKLGFDPYPGTLNLRLREADIERRRLLNEQPSVVIDGFRDRDRSFGPARCYPLTVNGEVEGALITAERTSYDASVIEVISPVYLRGRFGLRDGDTVTVTIAGPRRSSS